jgi:isoleucyl-tRNA synthetase
LLLQKTERNCSYGTNFGADDAKVAKEATPEAPPMFFRRKRNPVPLVDLQGKFIQNLGEYSGKICKE